MKRHFVRKNVGGLIFSSKGAYRSIEAWVEAKAPNDALIYDTPGNLIRAGLTIVDAHKVDGMYYRRKMKVPPSTNITLPRNVNKVVDPRLIPAQVFPGLIFFDKSKHKTQHIGTTGTSKVVREARKKAEAEAAKAKKGKSK